MSEQLSAAIIPAELELPVHYVELDLHDLSARQEAVGGYLQALDLVEPAATMYMNDEGKLDGLPINQRATALLWVHNPAFRNFDVIAGDVLLVGPVDERGDDTAIPEGLTRILAATACAVEVQVQGSDEWEQLPGVFPSWYEAYVAGLTDPESETIRLVK